MIESEDIQWERVEGIVETVPSCTYCGIMFNPHAPATVVARHADRCRPTLAVSAEEGRERSTTEEGTSDPERT